MKKTLKAVALLMSAILLAETPLVSLAEETQDIQIGETDPAEGTKCQKVPHE